MQYSFSTSEISIESLFEQIAEYAKEPDFKELVAKAYDELLTGKNIQGKISELFIGLESYVQNMPIPTILESVLNYAIEVPDVHASLAKTMTIIKHALHILLFREVENDKKFFTNATEVYAKFNQMYGKTYEKIVYFFNKALNSFIMSCFSNNKRFLIEEIIKQYQKKELTDVFFVEEFTLFMQEKETEYEKIRNMQFGNQLLKDFYGELATYAKDQNKKQFKIINSSIKSEKAEEILKHVIILDRLAYMFIIYQFAKYYKYQDFSVVEERVGKFFKDHYEAIYWCSQHKDVDSTVRNYYAWFFVKYQDEFKLKDGKVDKFNQAIEKKIPHILNEENAYFGKIDFEKKISGLDLILTQCSFTGKSTRPSSDVEE